jgi:nicotinamide-nucleotide amidase
MMAARGHTIALAESCTAGRVAAWLGEVPGASRYFMEGAVLYSDAAKIRTCGVTAEALAAHGAVSEPIARQLADGIRARAATTWGIGITGIAGPTGGTPEKPVGTVHLAIAGPNETTARTYHFRGHRNRVTSFAAAAALAQLHRKLRV